MAKFNIEAFKGDDTENGECIVLTIGNVGLVCCALDIDDIIVKLTEAKDYALNSDVTSERLDFSPDL
jgi:hypothetical protein